MYTLQYALHIKKVLHIKLAPKRQLKKKLMKLNKNWGRNGKHTNKRNKTNRSMYNMYLNQQSIITTFTFHFYSDGWDLSELSSWGAWGRGSLYSYWRFLECPRNAL